MSNVLPVFRLAQAETEFSQTIALAQNLFEIKDDFKISKQEGKHALNNARFLVETANGGLDVWASDTTQYLNPTLRPLLLNEKEALKTAKQLVEQKQLLPNLQKPFEYGKPQLGGTLFAQSEKQKRSDFQLDQKVVFPILVNGLPVVGVWASRAGADPFQRPRLGTRLSICRLHQSYFALCHVDTLLKQ